MSKIPRPIEPIEPPTSRNGVSFVDEKYRDEIFAALANKNVYDDLDFVNIEQLVDIDDLSFISAFYLIESLVNSGVSLFVVGFSQPFEMAIVEAAVTYKKLSQRDIIILIVNC